MSIGRKTKTGVTHVLGGCYTCGGSDAMWDSKNALALAAKHHDKTGHPTWAEQVLSVKYGDAPKVVRAASPEGRGE